MSHLASVQKIINIEAIEGADLIEKATVLGWQLVVKKGEFKIGQLIGYIQIDTVCPDVPEFEFLRERKFRVRSIKLRKQISQGLIVPLPKGNWLEGNDLTEVLNIKKYEKVDNNPELYEKPKMPKVWYKKYIYLFKYNFLYKIIPSLLPKQRTKFPTNLVSITDEERIQNIPQILEQYKGKQFITSYKLDGSSITIIYNKFLWLHKFRICSRKFELHNKNNDWYKVFDDTNFGSHILKLVRYYSTNNIIVQGEAIGKFNGNHHGLTKDEIRLFNIIVKGKRLKPTEFHNTCHILSIPNCPMYTAIDMNHSMNDILKMSEIKDILNPKVDAEGLVWRCVDDGFSFKVINNNFLINKNE